MGLTRSDFGLLRQKKAIGEDSSILAAVFMINGLILSLIAQDLKIIPVSCKGQKQYSHSHQKL